MAQPILAANRRLVADLVLAAAMIARETGTTAVPFENGLVEFRRGDRVVSSHVFVSGGGTRRRAAVESELSSRRRRYKGLATPPSGAVVAGTSDAAGLPVTPPTDLINGDAPGDIVSGAWALPMFHTEVLRQNPALCRGVAP